MAIRANHYDAAFEAFLREERIPYVAVDEQRRALCGDESLKSLDFVVYSPAWGNLLVDVKGRKEATSGPGGRRWENWATAEDLVSLGRWQTLFGPSFRAMLVFAYQVSMASAASAHAPAFSFRDRQYGFYGVWADDYRQAMKTRSPRWETVWVPSRPYRELRFSLATLGRPPASVAG